MTAENLPVIRLKPKANAAAIRHGFPWAYDNEIVTDRRTRSISPGSLAMLEDAERRPLGIVTVNSASRIFARVLDRDVTAEIGREWVEEKLARALELRERIFDDPFYRLVHAEADGLPGVVVDRFGDAAVLQANIVWAENMAETIALALQSILGVRTVLLNGTSRARQLENLPERTEFLSGGVDAPIPVPMNGATYLADITGGQKTGLFFDQRPNHAFAARLASRGGDVLDVFSHVGGFSLAALAAGAASALSVDGSGSALELARQGAVLSGVSDRLETRQGDAFDVMEQLDREGRRFDVVICDPPAFAPRKSALEAGLRAYERVARLAAPLVRPGGYLVLCSCSHAADLARFRSASARGVGKAGRSAQLIHTGFAGPDHPMLVQLAESGYLKSLFFRLN